MQYKVVHWEQVNTNLFKGWVLTKTKYDGTIKSNGQFYTPFLTSEHPSDYVTLVVTQNKLTKVTTNMFQQVNPDQGFNSNNSFTHQGTNVVPQQTQVQPVQNVNVGEQPMRPSVVGMSSHECNPTQQANFKVSTQQQPFAIKEVTKDGKTTLYTRARITNKGTEAKGYMTYDVVTDPTPGYPTTFKVRAKVADLGNAIQQINMILDAGYDPVVSLKNNDEAFKKYRNMWIHTSGDSIVTAYNKVNNQAPQPLPWEQPNQPQSQEQLPWEQTPQQPQSQSFEPHHLATEPVVSNELRFYSQQSVDQLLHKRLELMQYVVASGMWATMTKIDPEMTMQALVTSLMIEMR